MLSAASPAIAQQATGVGVGVANSSSRSAAAAQAIGGGQAISNSAGGRAQSANALTINSAAIPSSTSTTASINTVPNVFAPGLTAAGLETCLGSVSLGASWLGTGLTGGGTIPDPGCAARLDARTLWSFGLKKAAIARLCLTPQIYQSMPEVCVQYLPQPPGYAVAAVAPPPPVYEGGPVEVVMQKTGEHRMCANFDESRHRCRVWARN